MNIFIRENTMPRIIYRLIFLILILSVYQVVCYAQESSQEQVFPQMKLKHDDRILILAPHPDDEILGCGGVIQRAKEMGLPLKIVFFTYGDNNQWSFIVYRKHPVIMPKAVKEMGLVRYKEALDAAKLLGLLPQQLVFLGYPDFRTLAIWYENWADQPPAKSMLSQTTEVPYSNAFRPGALYKGEDIVKDLKSIFSDFKPTKIFLSHPADHNPDHRSLYLFTRVALWEMGLETEPVLYPYLIHFKQWPQPKGYKPNERMIPPPLIEKEISWKIINLSPQEVEADKKAIRKHRSQYISCPKYLLSFIRSDELFGDFPVISLKEQKLPRILSRHSQGYLSEFPEELIYEERVDFVGIEEEFLTLEDKTLVFNLKLSRPVGNKIKVSLYVFGYRKDTPFGNMPKLHIMLEKNSYQVYEKGRLLQTESVHVDRKPNEVTINIPLEILGNPIRILTSARTYRGLVPLDWVEWRILEIDGRNN